MNIGEPIEVLEIPEPEGWPEPETQPERVAEPEREPVPLPPPTRPLPVRQRATPVLGYRVWRMTEDGHLGAITRDQVWAPGRTEAQCVEPGHRAPEPGCGCGLYAEATLRPDDAGYEVVGAVIGWGRVVRHAGGWRAQHARVVAVMSAWWTVGLWSSSDPKFRRLAAAGTRYGVPWFRPDQEDKFLRYSREFGERADV